VTNDVMTHGENIPDEIVAEVAAQRVANELGFETFDELKAALDESRGTEPTWLRKRLARERRLGRPRR
jgi:DNA-binding MurR/RpiR family transcriptional regulator